jgi:hypothetical protein
VHGGQAGLNFSWLSLHVGRSGDGSGGTTESLTMTTSMATVTTTAEIGEVFGMLTQCVSRTNRRYKLRNWMEVKSTAIMGVNQQQLFYPSHCLALDQRLQY